ncbi:hypothetical protein ACFLFF_31455 [Brevibacillus reuszeri]|uniref:hypothetical protein n=1 Tax=Brevibacillus reuszeri TaxID=54915 RepID=UPI00366C7F2E
MLVQFFEDINAEEPVFYRNFDEFTLNVLLSSDSVQIDRYEFQIASKHAVIQNGKVAKLKIFMKVE